SGIKWVTAKLPLSFDVVSNAVLFEIEVTVTFAPLTAFPCASVTVPMMLPKTAWPEAVYVHRLKQKQNTARATHTDRLAITPLLKPVLESFQTRTHCSRTASSTEFIWVRELLCGPQTAGQLIASCRTPSTYTATSRSHCSRGKPEATPQIQQN